MDQILFDPTAKELSSRQIRFADNSKPYFPLFPLDNRLCCTDRLVVLQHQTFNYTHIITNFAYFRDLVTATQKTSCSCIMTIDSPSEVSSHSATDLSFSLCSSSPFARKFALHGVSNRNIELSRSAREIRSRATRTDKKIILA